MAIAPTLLQAIKICRQACPPSILMCFSQASIPEGTVKKIHNRQSYSTFVESDYFYKMFFQQTLNSFVNFDVFFTNQISAIRSCDKNPSLL
jgi:hypothetical protein